MHDKVFLFTKRPFFLDGISELSIVAEILTRAVQDNVTEKTKKQGVIRSWMTFELAEWGATYAAQGDKVV
jgi:hypothetical protein